MTPDDPDNSQPPNLISRPEWLRWLQHWERGLLVIVLVAVFVMAASLLWPKPQAVIALKPYASTLPQSVARPDEASVEEVITPEDSALESGAATDGNDNAVGSIDSKTNDPHAAKGKKRESHPHFQKKPDHPPITNLNTAKLSQLQLLPGIGPKMAERIVEYRKTNGSFKNVEQIMDVKGIGPKKFEKMKAFLKV